MRFADSGRDYHTSTRDLAGGRRDRRALDCADLRGASPKRYLTDDEIIEVAPRDEPLSFRLRIWRGRACPAIALVSQLAGGPSPSWLSSHSANLVHRAYLGFPAEGMHYFEDETISGERRLFFLEFSHCSHGLRRGLTWPVRHEFDWAEMEAMVSQKIAR